MKETRKDECVRDMDERKREMSVREIGMRERERERAMSRIG